MASARDHAVFIVVDDLSIRRALRDVLASFDMHAIAFGSAADYGVHERPALPAWVILDVQRPDNNCLDPQDELKDHPPKVFIRVPGATAHH